MTEKTEYIAASIDLLEQEDELNSTELAVLCNLKKYMNKADHQPTFEVGEYYKCSDIIYRVTSVGGSQIKYAKFYSEANKFYSESSASLNSNFCDNSKPASAEQIAEFKLAEAIANTGLHADQIRQMLSNGKIPMGPWLALQKTAEELREVGKDG